MFSKPSAIDVEKMLDHLAKEAKDSYDLSLVLMASGQLADIKRYNLHLESFKKMSSNLEDSSEKAWMLGRLAFAAALVDDQNTLASTVIELKNLLAKISLDCKTAWALGYLASAHYDETSKKLIESGNLYSDSIADQLWICVLNLQAAARAQDQVTYQFVLKQMKSITDKKSISLALEGIPVNDWRAWAVGIVFLAAVTAEDHELYQELKIMAKTNIKEALEKNLTANTLMAEVNLRIAEKKLTQDNACSCQIL